jgi:hypothetical protein
MKRLWLTLLLCTHFAVSWCQSSPENEDMVATLKEVSKKVASPYNPFASEARLQRFLQEFQKAYTLNDSISWQFLICNSLLELGEEGEAIRIGEEMLQRLANEGRAPQQVVKRLLGMCYLRMGERINCIKNHTGESCIFPIRGGGIQQDTAATRTAIRYYTDILSTNINDLESRWLLNVGYMAIGGYPQEVPKEFLIPGLADPDSVAVKPFKDIAMQKGLSIGNQAGGSVVDDINNDGYLDIVTTGWDLSEGMHYFQSTGDGEFKDMSVASGIDKITGGLNLVQTDYNNDGFIDLFVLRGAWLRNYGEEPTSLLRNNGDGTFTDVTKKAGLFALRPSHSAAWADFDNDGWLDVYVGHETTVGKDNYPNQLFMNNRDGTFREVAKAAGIDFSLFVKGVTAGDYNNDDLTDLFLSTLDGKKVLLRNMGVKNGTISFKNVSEEAGLTKDTVKTFPTWFWDYDNDGYLDILFAGYDFERSLGWYSAEAALGLGSQRAGKVFVYRNKGDGTFENVSDKLGLKSLVYAMGANFGDINNDGYPDMYFGTGNPVFQSLIPNKMFLNLGGQKFADVTSSSRLGNLQKGHGISFADFDNDGDQDIYIEMGGAYPGDAYQNSFYINPGQNDNHWIKIALEGKDANKAAIGAKIKLTIDDAGHTRSVYKVLNSGGSFGSNPLMQQIGIGQATTIKKLEIKWPGCKHVQTLENIKADQQIKITEGNNKYVVKKYKTFNLLSSSNNDMHNMHNMPGMIH